MLGSVLVDNISVVILAPWAVEVESGTRFREVPMSGSGFQV